MSSLTSSAASVGAVVPPAPLSVSRASSPLTAQHKNSSGSLRHMSPQKKLTMDSTLRRSRPASGNDQVAEAKPEQSVAHVQQSSGFSLDCRLKTTGVFRNVLTSLTHPKLKFSLRKKLYRPVHLLQLSHCRETGSEPRRRSDRGREKSPVLFCSVRRVTGELSGTDTGHRPPHRYRSGPGATEPWMRGAGTEGGGES